MVMLPTYLKYRVKKNDGGKEEELGLGSLVLAIEHITLPTLTSGFPLSYPLNIFDSKGRPGQESNEWDSVASTNWVEQWRNLVVGCNAASFKLGAVNGDVSIFSFGFTTGKDERKTLKFIDWNVLRKIEEGDGKRLAETNLCIAQQCARQLFLEDGLLSGDREGNKKMLAKMLNEMEDALANVQSTSVDNEEAQSMRFVINYILLYLVLHKVEKRTNTTSWTLWYEDPAIENAIQTDSVLSSLRTTAVALNVLPPESGSVSATNKFKEGVQNIDTSLVLNKLLALVSQ